MSGLKKSSDGKICEHVLAIYRYYLKPKSERTSSDYARMVTHYYLLTTPPKYFKLTGTLSESEGSWVEEFMSVIESMWRP